MHKTAILPQTILIDLDLDKILKYAQQFGFIYDLFKAYSFSCNLNDMSFSFPVD